jgi:hypothetical protein
MALGPDLMDAAPRGMTTYQARSWPRCGEGPTRRTHLVDRLIHRLHDADRSSTRIAPGTFSRVTAGGDKMRPRQFRVFPRVA